MSAPTRSTVKTIAIDTILVGKRQRSFNPATAEAIAQTLPTLGLQQPIGVWADGDGFRLVFGHHRLEAAKLAGWTAIEAKVITLDERDLEASSEWHEALENLIRRELNALDRMAHLSAAKFAHDRLYPEAAKTGKSRTRTDETNRPIFGLLAFSREVASQTGFSNSLIKLLISAFRKFDQKTVLRLRNSKLAERQSELIALAAVDPGAHHNVLDLLLSDPPQAASVEDALAIVEERARPDKTARKINRTAETLKTMPIELRDKVFDAAEDAVRDYAKRRGWL